MGQPQGAGQPQGWTTTRVDNHKGRGNHKGLPLLMGIMGRGNLAIDMKWHFNDDDIAIITKQAA